MRKQWLVALAVVLVLLVGVGPQPVRTAGSPENYVVLLGIKSRVRHQGLPGVGRVRFDVVNLLPTMTVEAGTCLWRGSFLDCRPGLDGQVRFWVVATKEGWYTLPYEEFDLQGEPLRADDIYLHVVVPIQIYLPLVGK